MGGLLCTLRIVNSQTRERRNEVLDTRQPKREYLGARGSMRTFKNEQARGLGDGGWGGWGDGSRC